MSVNIDLSPLSISKEEIRGAHFALRDLIHQANLVDEILTFGSITKMTTCFWQRFKISVINPTRHVEHLKVSYANPFPANLEKGLAEYPSWKHLPSRIRQRLMSCLRHRWPCRFNPWNFPSSSRRACPQVCRWIASWASYLPWGQKESHSRMQSLER